MWQKLGQSCWKKRDGCKIRAEFVQGGSRLNSFANRAVRACECSLYLRKSCVLYLQCSYIQHACADSMSVYSIAGYQFPFVMQMSVQTDGFLTDHMWGKYLYRCTILTVCTAIYLVGSFDAGLAMVTPPGTPLENIFLKDFLNLNYLNLNLIDYLDIKSVHVQVKPA